MNIPNSLIVVIQNEPRDGDIVYLEQDEEAYRNRVVELDMVERESASEIVELGGATYWNDDDSTTIKGYEVQFPYPISNVCADCFPQPDSGYQIHKVGTGMVVNFVEDEACENGHLLKEDIDASV